MKFFNRLHVYAKFHKNQKGSRIFLVDLQWNDPYVKTLCLLTAGALLVVLRVQAAAFV